MTIHDCRKWLNFLWARNGAQPTKIWVDEDIYQELFILGNFYKVPWAEGYAIGVNGIPVLPR